MESLYLKIALFFACFVTGALLALVRLLWRRITALETSILEFAREEGAQYRDANSTEPQSHPNGASGVGRLEIYAKADLGNARHEQGNAQLPLPRRARRGASGGSKEAGT